MPASKVAIVIPARYDSTRFPGKPLHLIAGKTLLEHVWKRCGKAQGIDAVVIATDDMRIAEAAFAFGAEVSLTSNKHQSGTDRVAEVAKRLDGFSHIINVQGDEPLIQPSLITRLAKTLTKEPNLEMITVAHPFGQDEDVNSSNAVKVVLDRYADALYFSRSPIPFVRDNGPSPAIYRHQGIYGYAMKFLLQFVRWKPGILEQAEQLEQLRALENGTKIRVLLAKSGAIGVDTLEDAAMVEKILLKR
jgi:3-deoxy-manno-octulosonate cytidylyltransferase (CMP-KDO synthetase)